jgi:hypothetical protein
VFQVDHPGPHLDGDVGRRQAELPGGQRRRTGHRADDPGPVRLARPLRIGDQLADVAERGQLVVRRRVRPGRRGHRGPQLLQRVTAVEVQRAEPVEHVRHRLAPDRPERLLRRRAALLALEHQHRVPGRARQRLDAVAGPQQHARRVRYGDRHPERPALAQPDPVAGDTGGLTAVRADLEIPGRPDLR